MKQKIVILGADGYLGWSLFVYLQKHGYTVYGCDNFTRRKRVKREGSDSLFPLKKREQIKNINITHYIVLKNWFKKINPDVIIHLAEQPSAPYSMMNGAKAKYTQYNNIISTLNILWIMREVCPDAHLIKLGTMGEYGDSIYNHLGINIPEENKIKVIYQKKEIEIPTPRFAGSFYHLSKIYDSFNIEFACKLWNLRATDINQGPVYGTRIDEMETDDELTRFDYDAIFGTVINRFITQAVAGMPLTIYGKGEQKRGFINLNDVMRAIELIIQKTPESGEFRIVNQLTEVFTINELANLVQKIGLQFGLNIWFKHQENPRIELEKHYYQPEYNKLLKWGLSPRYLADELPQMFEDVLRFKNIIKKEVINPTIKWR